MESDLELVLKCTKKLETLLTTRLGAEGRGLHEKVSSVEKQLTQKQIQDIRYIATIRNKLLHEDGYEQLEYRDRFLERYQNTLDSFLPIKYRNAVNQIDTSLNDTLDKYDELMASIRDWACDSKNDHSDIGSLQAMGLFGGLRNQHDPTKPADCQTDHSETTKPECSSHIVGLAEPTAKRNKYNGEDLSLKITLFATMILILIFAYTIYLLK